MSKRNIFQKDYPSIIKNSIRFFTDKLVQDKRCIVLEKKTSYHLFPNLSKNSIVYSGGVGSNIALELELIKKYNSKIFVFDPSPMGEETMSNIKNSNIKFYPIGLANKSGKKYYEEEYSRKKGNKKKASYKISLKGDNFFQCTSISDFFKKNNHEKIDLLKIDIEGFEYGVLEDIFKNKIPVNQIILEFHGWMKRIPKKLDKIAKKKLKEEGYKLVYKRNDDYTYLKVK